MGVLGTVFAMQTCLFLPDEMSGGTDIKANIDADDRIGSGKEENRQGGDVPARAYREVCRWAGAAPIRSTSGPNGVKVDGSPGSGNELGIIAPSTVLRWDRLHPPTPTRHESNPHSPRPPRRFRQHAELP